MSDTWTLVSGYTASDYADDMVWEVDTGTKKLVQISGQALVAGEENSQYIVFKMDRYWDGIDISGMTINIMYELNTTYFGTSTAVAAEITDDSLRFGWIVPAEACCVTGTLLFVLVITDTDYTLKTQIATTSVYSTISEDDVVPEPTSAAWYEEFQTRVDAALDNAENALSQAQSVLAQAQTYVGAPLVASTAAEMTDTSRVYVYVGSEDGYTSGNWYYYDGSAWTSGGVYNAVAVSTDTTLTQSGVPADAEATGDAITQLNADITAKVEDVESDISALVDTNNITLALSAFASGYINNSGNVASDNGMTYTSVEITSDMIGMTIYVSGSAWYTIKPYVFVGESESVIYAPVANPGGTATQHTGLEFVPTEEGTLYINKYGSTHTATAYTIEIANIKSEMLPSPLPITDTVTYSPVSLTFNDKSLLNGRTGAITTDDTYTTYKVTDYTEVTAGSKIMLTTKHHWGSGLFVFYDENRQFISGRRAASGSTMTYVYNEVIDVPSTAAYIVIGVYQTTTQEAFLWQGAEANALPSQRWSGKKWALIGDSLTAHNSRASMHYYDYISGATGITLENLAASGQGYGQGASNFMAQALNVPSDADVVTIFGSFNDLSSGLDVGTVTDSDTSTLAGCVNITLDNIQSIIPLANIGVIAPTPWETTQPSTSGNAYNYVEMVKAICEKRSIPFLDLWRGSNLRPWDSDFLEYAYSNDDGGGTHPDNNGHAMIAPRIKAFLETLLM